VAGKISPLDLASELLMMINAAGRQTASSAGTSVSTEPIANAYELAQTQLQGVFGVMPCMLPNDNSGGLVKYGVPYAIGKEMAKRAVDEDRVRNSLLSPEIQRAEVHKLIEERKNASIMVRRHAAYKLDVNQVCKLDVN
jgi:hypothetical protein